MPVFAIVGAQLDAAKRRSYVDWQHSVFDGPALVRDFTKFDDTPISLSHFAESANRAHEFSMTPPYGPVLLAVDQNLQEDPIEKGVAASILKQVQPYANYQSQFFTDISNSALGLVGSRTLANARVTWKSMSQDG